MRVVFFGTPEFAVPTLQRLLSEPDFEVVGIVSQPDTRRGRGNQVSPPPVKAAAIADLAERLLVIANFSAVSNSKSSKIYRYK